MSDTVKFVVGILGWLSLSIAVWATLGCSNDAITYAHKLDPDAVCSALSASTPASTLAAGDRAVCQLRTGAVWFCVVSPFPECRVVLDAVDEGAAVVPADGPR